MQVTCSFNTVGNSEIEKFYLFSILKNQNINVLVHQTFNFNAPSTVDILNGLLELTKKKLNLNNSLNYHNVNERKIFFKNINLIFLNFLLIVKFDAIKNISFNTKISNFFNFNFNFFMPISLLYRLKNNLPLVIFTNLKSIKKIFFFQASKINLISFLNKFYPTSLLEKSLIKTNALNIFNSS